MTDDTRRIYEDKKVVSFYERLDGLQACEAYAFSKYLGHDIDILDIGVGGGRTTSALSRKARRYVGIDYSEGMVDACIRRFADLEFYHCDATNLDKFSDNEFDAVIFSFNGIDSIQDDFGRARCLSEIKRTLRPGGVFIFSSHNSQILGVLPDLVSAKGYQIPWRIIRSLIKSVAIFTRAISTGIYRRKIGYVVDGVHGGIKIYCSTPDSITGQIENAGLKVVEIVNSRFPIKSSKLFVPWYYYVCRLPKA